MYMNKEEREAWKEEVRNDRMNNFKDDPITEGRTVIVGERATGKTTELVKLSAKSNLPIFTPYLHHVKIFKEIAQQLELTIPEPVTGDCRGRKGVLVDEAQFLLQDLIGCKVYGMTLTGETVDLNKVEEETSANINNINIKVDVNCKKDFDVNDFINTITNELKQKSYKFNK